MQLGKLRSAIRNHRGNIHLEAMVAGRVLQVPVQKTPFLNEMLPSVFGSDKSVETEMEFDDGMVRYTGDDDIGTIPPEPEVYYAGGPTGREDMTDEGDPLGDLLGATDVSESDNDNDGDDEFMDLIG